MKDKLLGIRSTMHYTDKEEQQDKLFQDISRMLFIASAMIGEVGGEEEMFDAINRIEILPQFLGIEAGEHTTCLRPGCKFKTHANFFKSSENDIWLYKCPCCQTGEETITLAEFILEVFRRKYPNCSHRTIVQLIRRTFDVDFSKPFYKEIERRTSYNLDKLVNTEKDSYLHTLVRKRKLAEFYEEYSKIALMYTGEDNFDYSFYASRGAILEYFNEVKSQSKSNAIVEKINLLSDLGFIKKIQFDDIPLEFREKARYKENKETWSKDVSAYKTETITEEQLVQAEEIAKAVICNKIYRNKVSLEETISETCSFTKEEEQFLNRANKAIEDELNTKGYIALSSLVSKIDKKGKYYKKDEKEKLFNLLEDRIMLEANLKKIKATATNKKKYNMKRVKDKETILIRSDKKLEIAPRVRVKESIRKAKKKKSEKIIAKKKKAKAPTIVRTYIDGGCTMALMSDGTIDMIDIPF
jgi:hypothetical protein